MRLPDDSAEDQGSAAIWLALGLMLAAAFALRVDRISERPFDVGVTRQYRGALIARALYYRSDHGIPAWKRTVAEINWQNLDTLEPPVLEALSIVAYHLHGSEDLDIPRSLSSAFWVLGGIPLFYLARRFAGAGAAFCSLAFYLFTPFAVAASRTIQPDPLMTMLFVWSIAAIDLLQRRPSHRRLLLAGSVSGAAILVKPMCVFAIVGAILCLQAHADGFKRTLANRRMAAFLVLALAPSAVWSGILLLHPGLLRGVARGSLAAHLYFTATFWGGWLLQIGKATGVVPFAIALAGLTAFARGRTGAMLSGLWLGYVVYGFAFPYQTHTHSYYHLQLIPIAALSASPLIASIFTRLTLDRSAPAAAIALAVTAIAFAIGWTTTVDGSHEARLRQLSQEIGAAVEHSTQTLFMAENYGGPLRYFGELAGRPWPQSIDFNARKLLGVPDEGAEQRLKTMLARQPAFFFIITERRELALQPDLEQLLAMRYAKLADTADYLIYDLRRPLRAAH